MVPAAAGAVSAPGSPPGGAAAIGVLAGVTATGKSALAMGLAQAHGAIEIVNADSLNVYRRMDIGTAKPAPSDLRAVRHHLIDVRDPGEEFNAGDFRREALAAISDIESRGRRALVVGGTGFYLEALIFGMWGGAGTAGSSKDPAIRARLDALPDAALFERLRAIDEPAALQISPGDRYRLARALELYEQTGKTPSQHRAEHPKEADPRFRLWVVDRENADLERRISERAGRMIDRGLVQETRSLLDRCPDARALGSVGYAQVRRHLEGRRPEGRKPEPGLAGLRQEIELATRRLVKKQRTWFRGQAARVPGALWFTLPADSHRLLQAFEACYGPTPTTP